MCESALETYTFDKMQAELRQANEVIERLVGVRKTTLASTLRALCEYAKDPANGVWLADVETVAGHTMPN